MIKGFELYNHLGFHNPFYIDVEGEIVISSSLDSLMKKIPNRTLDYTALVEILCTGFAFGDRTLIKEIKRTPWMARPDKSLTSWEYFHLPKHQEVLLNESEIAHKFYELLENELIGYTQNVMTIGLLLTGGMDSRIVAAILHRLIKTQRISKKRVIAFTWGMENSRDVIYAKRISDLYNWEWRHLTVDVSQMEENCVLAIENGCEFTPIHLHAMSKVSDDDLDCVLAGSFGDSIGRAEYSGTSVEYLKSIKSSIRNYGGILRHDYAKLTKKNVEKDIEEYHLLFPQDKKYQQYELDLQIHYMRRMLNPCMGIIDKKIPLYQMFSSPEVISYIWSIHPSKRNNLVYKYIIDEYAPELKEVPWARTGLKYTENEGIPDLYKKQHHNYGEMIRTYFLEDIEVRIKDNDILAKQLFNYKGLLKLIQNIKNYPMDGKHIYEERLLWISLVLDFINKNQISLNIPEYKPGIAEGFKSEIEYKYRFFLAKG